MKKSIALILAAACLLSAAACVVRSTENESEHGYGLWFAVSGKSERNDYSAVGRESRNWHSEPTVEEMMQALLEGPVSNDLESPFPPGVELLSITVNENTHTARVDLSEQYGDLVGFDLTLADYCITLTLCQRPDIEAVRVTVEGSIIPYRDRQKMTAGDVLLSGITEEPDTFLAALYFPRRSSGTLVTEYRQVSRTDGSRAVDIVMEELLKGPSERRQNDSMPEGVRIRSLTVSDGVCEIDLSDEFVANAPKDDAMAGLTLYALVNTLCALGGVSQVRLLVEGEVLEMYGNIPTSVPISANYDLAGQ